MKIYTYSEVRGKLASLLEESKTEEVVIRRRKGDVYAIVPKSAQAPAALLSMFLASGKAVPERRFSMQFENRESGAGESQ